MELAPQDPPPGAYAPRPNQWETIAASPEFKDLVRAKLRFIIPGTIFFVIYYVSLLVIVGFVPSLSKKELLGHANFAYLFGLSQFFMAWIMAAIYMKAAAGWDRRVEQILSRSSRR